MNRTSTICLLLLCAGIATAAEGTVRATELSPLPEPISNNAAVGMRSGENEFIVSFAGLGAGRSRADTLAKTYVFDGRSGKWSRSGPVPGNVGRLAAVATAAGGLAYVFGGYTVAEDGSEVSTPWVHAFDPATGKFEERTAMPVPVDDAMAVTYMDRFIYLISGWHDLGNVNLVQRYDTRTDSWTQATPTPGRGVFGNAGGIVGNTIVYCDGVAIKPYADRRREFVANSECFEGLIDADDPRRIDWRTVAAHPGLPRYRMAAAGISSLNAVVFIGGSDNPYNYDGIGYNGEPSQPVADILLYDLESRSWSMRTADTAPSMDHRALVEFNGNWLTVGGMLKDQQVSDRVSVYWFE